MSLRLSRRFIEKERTLYEELLSAMMSLREYNGYYIMQYSESQENGQMVGKFILRCRNNKESLPE